MINSNYDNMISNSVNNANSVNNTNNTNNTDKSNNADNANDLNNPPYLQSPAMKSFTGVQGVKGNARLTRPSYNTGNDTWVSEYKYKDSDVEVVIRQKVKVSAHNNELLSNYYVQNEVIEVSNTRTKKSDNEEVSNDLPKGDFSREEAVGTLKNIKEQMLANPADAMKAQARQTNEGVMALVL